MRLDAIVTNSVFNEIVGKLTMKELWGVCRLENEGPGGNMLVVTAEVSPAKALEVVRKTCASIEKPDLGSLKSIDYVSLQAHDELTDHNFETCTGIVTLWLPAGERW